MTDFNINELLPSSALDNPSAEYLLVHKKRYLYLLKKTEKLRTDFSDKNITILDIGPSLFTLMLEKHFPSDRIFSLGLDNEKSRGGHLPKQVQLKPGSFFHFNLNDVQYPEILIELPQCDIIIMAEVLEHLYTSPVLIFNYLKNYIKNGGYFIIQTPNGASLKNRISLLLGKNPFELIRENSENPGHFREYTIKELISYAEKTGFSVESVECKSYFNPRNFVEKVYKKVTDFLPKTFRNGITIILKKP